MMYSASLSPVWWDDAMTWAVQLLNIRPSSTLWISEADMKSLKEKKPDEYKHLDKPWNISPHFALTGEPADVRNWRSFGSLCYAVMGGVKKSLVGAEKAVKCMYLGVTSSGKGWRLVNVATGQRFISTHVVCLEDFRERDQWMETFDNTLSRVRREAMLPNIGDDRLTEVQNENIIKALNMGEFRSLFRDKRSPLTSLTPDDTSFRLTTLADPLTSDVGEIEEPDGNEYAFDATPLDTKFALVDEECGENNCAQNMF